METLNDLLRGASPVLAERPALLGPGRRPLTRGGLIEQIDRTALALAGDGIRPGDRVAICLPDGPELAAAFLAVGSVAGCAPLNPALKEEEVAFALSDLGARALLVAEGSDPPARRAAAHLKIRVLDVASDSGGAGTFRLRSISSASRPLSPAAPHDVALLLHTSGTTSKPKLVPLTHANLCASAREIARTLELSPEDRCLNVMPLFHIHGLAAALLASLAAGASVACAPGFDAPRFFEWLDELEPTWFTAVPTMHQAILARAQRNGGPLGHHRLRFLRSSSAPLPPQVLSELERVFGVPVIEAYGMTEAAHQMASNPLPPRARKPGTVGVSAGAEIAIEDDSGRFLGSDETGQVLVRGPGVTPGYLGDPAANARAFVNGWFRTGDQGRLDADGYLTLTGRLKEIINRAGEKISPREIDEVLLSHPAVAQAVAFAIPHRELGEDVGAAVVLRGDRIATPQELRELVASRLADFKIPRRIAIVSEIPKGPTGKLQRVGLAQKLGLASEPPPSGVSERVLPRTPIERELARIWSEVLRVDPMGATDDFFALGGDSVLAGRVVSRVRAVFGFELSLVALFETPTISGIAARIVQAPSASKPADERIPRREPGRSPVLSFGQQAIWFLDHLDRGSAAYNRSTNVRIRGSLDLAALERALDRILARHEVLRTAYPSNLGVPITVVSPPAERPLELRDLAGLPPEEREASIAKLAHEEGERPLDLERGPLVRTLLLRAGEEDHVLLTTVHHIVFDRLSVPLFVRELALLHDAFRRREPDPFPDLPIQYGDFAKWERERLSGAVLDGLLSFWRARLADASPLELPLDRQPAKAAPGRFRRISSVLSEPLPSRLASLAQSEHASLFIALLAGFHALLSARTGQRDLVVASDRAHRDRPEIEPLIGFFVNLLLFRTNLSGNPTFRQVLGRSRESALESYRHWDLPFSKLVERVRPARFSARAPLVRAMVVLNPAPAMFEAGGTRFEPLSPEDEGARFDLNLSIEPEPTGLTARWKYDANLFDERTIARLSRDYEALLARVAEHPETRLDELAAALRPE